LLSGGNERGAGKGRTSGCGGVVRPWGGGQLEVEGGVDRWGRSVNGRERGRISWAGWPNWAAEEMKWRGLEGLRVFFLFFLFFSFSTHNKQNKSNQNKSNTHTFILFNLQKQSIDFLILNLV
jgi:hypothetical protein